MPIDRDLLGGDEEVLLDLRPHWVFLFGPLALTLLALAAAIAVAVAFPSAPAAIAWVLAVMVIVPGIWLVARIVRWLGISLIVTNHRLILRRGILGRDIVQLRLNRITEVHSTQTLFERIIGAGRLVVEVQGETQAIAVDDVRRPKSLQRVLVHRLNDLERPEDDLTPPRGVPSAGTSSPPYSGQSYPGQSYPGQSYPGQSFGNPEAPRAGGLPGSPSGPPTSVAEQLIQLDDLRRRGILTVEEFEAKKVELLGRL